MKVLHYIPSMARNLGGVAAYLSILSGELGKQCELVIVTSVQENDLPMRNCKVVDLEGFRFTDAGLGLSWKGIKQFAALCDRILDTEKPDLVHINGIWSLDRWLMQRQALRKGIRTYIMPHGMLEPWILNRHYWTKKLPALLLYERRALRSAECLIATAESERENICRLPFKVYGLPCVEKVELVANGIDVSGIPIKDDWRIRKKILYVSRIHVKKGIEMLIDAVGMVNDTLRYDTLALRNTSLRNTYSIIVAGPGEEAYINELKQRASRLGVGEMFQFVGPVYGEEKWKLYQEADFFVLPTHSENFGYVIAESLACGTPVITTKGTPWGEIDGRCGLWIERTTEELQRAMLMMLDKSAEELEQMGRAGRKLIEDNYSARKMAEQLMKVYSL